MYSLFIDTTQKYCYLAVLKDKKIISKISILTHNNLTDLVVEHINQILKKTKVNKELIKNIYIAIGPGSFTGVRVSTTITKTWNLINNCSVYTISSLLLQLPVPNGTSLLDARGNKYFCGIYKNNKLVSKLKIINLRKVKSCKNIYKNYENIDIFNNLIYHMKDFRKVKDINNLSPLYIKQPV
ncbi:MAG: tRNA (adenosine(37)-N6)-threonylcarbamoyltransferase complex dimerization subunit type 1 TsaB [Mycoplasmataceae bacterium]|jgi:tRNA threonylcarbamoyl adenosine modification protein YeaZ|nr:tRNA (adenosine(37)-N6)-threonylcarbamoyltransferase complex dimerization subunit type 1 TsaB [Mycoplasmataceae bacterium]